MRTTILKIFCILLLVSLGVGCTGESPSQQAIGTFSHDLLCDLYNASRDDWIAPEADWLQARTCACGDAETAPCVYVDHQRDRRRGLITASSLELELPLPDPKPDWLRFSVAGLHPSRDFKPDKRRPQSLHIEITVRRLKSLSPVRREVSVDFREPWKDINLDLREITFARSVELRVIRDNVDEDILLAMTMPRLIARNPLRPPESRRISFQRENVLVYLVDTLRPDHMSIYGYGRPTSPKIDQLARDGLIFDLAYSTAAWTRPATASLLTSLYPSFHGANVRSSLHSEAITLAEQFRAAGWSTWAFVTNGNISGRDLGFEQGFDRFVTVRGKRRANHAQTEDLNEILFPFLEAHKDEPFFLYLHTVDPHSPYDPPTPYRGTFTDPGYNGPIQPQEINKKLLRAIEIEDRDLEFVKALYDESIYYQDAMLGKLFDHIAEIGLSDKLVTVLTSDHGEEFFEHGDWEHGKRLFEEQVRIPLLIWGDPVTRNFGSRRIDAPVQIIDVMPTLLNWFDIRASGVYQGQDLTRHLFGSRGQNDPRLIYFEELRADSKFDLISLRQDTLKLIERRPYGARGARIQLFELDQDPQELKDMSRSRRKDVRRMEREITAFQELLKNSFSRLPETSEPELDEETLKNLKALGYVGN